MKNMRQMRIQRGMTQKELSVRSGVSQPYINELEKGRKVNPSIIVLAKLANALGVSVSDILDEEVNKGSAHFIREPEYPYDISSGAYISRVKLQTLLQGINS